MSQNEQQDLEELYAVVTGYVQGVGFRDFVLRQARALGLRGYTRNESDGSVEVVAQGARPALEQLLQRLRRGPSAAEVERVATTWRRPAQPLSGFHIRY